MLKVSADERNTDGDSSAMTPLTPSELRLIELLEEVHVLANQLGLPTVDLYIPLNLRIEAWLWRSSQLLQQGKDGIPFAWGVPFSHE